MRTIGVGFKVAIYLLALTSFSVLLSNYSVYAEEPSVSTATVTINQSCSMVGTTNTAHTANLANGTYSGTNYPNGIGQTTLKVFCNDNAGFAIYAIGYTGNEYGNTKLHNDTLGTANDISTGIYTSGNTINSTWSMKLASVSGTYAPTIADGTNNTENFTTWHTIPTEYTKVAYRISTTDADNNGQGTGSSLTTTYDAYVSATQPAGTYIGQVKYTIVHPNMTNNSNKPVYALKATDCPENSICYAPNANDIIGSMSSLGSIPASEKAGSHTRANSTYSTTISSSTTVIELVAPNFARPGYGFAGWSTDYAADNNSTIYGPNETITITAGSLSPNGMILYPVWIASKGNMQEWTGCSGLTAATYDSTTGKVSATLNQITALTDTRDGNVYTVAKLADGQCWMVENLRLNAENTRGDTNKAKAQGYGDATDSAQGNLGKFIGLADSEDGASLGYTNGKTDATTANSIYYAGTLSGTAIMDIAQDYYACYRMPRYNNNNTNMSANATNSAGVALIDTKYGADDHSRWYSYGNYYNWAAAMASTKYYNSYYNSDNTEQNNSDAAGTSICPKGWQLPLGYQSIGTLNNDVEDDKAVASYRVGSFSYLDRKMGGNGGNQSSIAQSKKWRMFPNNFIYSGHYSTSGRNISYSHYWTRSANSNNTAYFFRVGSDRIEANTSSSYRNAGFPLRCIAEN